MSHLMALGGFIFSLPTVAYNQLQRRRTWRHPGQARVGAREATQFVGPGDDIVTLSGNLAPQIIGDRFALEDLATLADQGADWPLIDGEGQVYGDFLITDLDTTQRGILQGGVWTVCDFTLTLKRADDESGRPAGSSGPLDPVPSLDLDSLLGLF